MPEAKLQDGSAIDLEVRGQGPTVLLPVNPRPIKGPQADEMRKWGNDPALGQTLIEGLSDAFRVVAFDYEGHVLRHPRPDTLTPDNVARDLLAVADAASADRFAYYGYSWLALSGLQLALRTDRLSALVMGGFPPLDGPYEEMLRVTTAAYDMSRSPQTPPQATQQATRPAGASDGSDTSEELDWDSTEVSITEGQARQFVTLYQALRGFDDSAAQAPITCPRLCFAGSADEIEYSEKWGGVRVVLAGPLVNRRADLEALGWDVEVLDGLDHIQAMQASNVLPILRPWLASKMGIQLPD